MGVGLGCRVVRRERLWDASGGCAAQVGWTPTWATRRPGRDVKPTHLNLAECAAIFCTVVGGFLAVALGGSWGTLAEARRRREFWGSRRRPFTRA